MANSVFLEVDGSLYEGFTDLNYSKNVEDLSGSFSFTASTQGVQFTPFKGQEVCKILINNDPIITGFIENLTYSYDNTSHSIEVSGRDKTADIIDNSLVGNVDFKAPITLETIIRDTLDLAGLTDIQVINEAGDLAEFTEFGENESSAGEVGENMFEFLEKFCRKRDVLLSSNGAGNVVITTSGRDEIDGILLNELANNSNNVKEASISYDFSNRYFEYICRSQGNPSMAQQINPSGEGLASLSGTKGLALDDEIRPTRTLEFQNETSATSTSNDQRARWEANIRRARSKVYTCQLRSLFANEEETVFYEPNKLIKVKDDFCDIDAIMLIRSVNYNLSNDSGTNVTLELVPKDAYTPQASKDKIDAKYNKIGESIEDSPFVLPGVKIGSFIANANADENV